MIKFFSRLAFVALALSALAGNQAKAIQTLADFVNANGDSNGQSLVVGDKTFSNFTYKPTGDMPPASGVTVTGVVNGSNVGLEFTGAFTDIPPPSSDATIAYTVTVNTPGVFITDWHLSGNPSAPNPTAFVGVTDTFTTTGGSNLNFQAPNGTNTLNIFANNPPGPPGGVKTSDDGIFVTPVTSLRVSKDILISSVTSIGNLSIVDQIASQSGGVVPEPGTIALAACGLPLLLVASRRHRKTVGKTLV